MRDSPIFLQSQRKLKTVFFNLPEEAERETEEVNDKSSKFEMEAAL